MRVFWSWQSDTPGKVGRHLVRDALQDAIDLLNEESDIDEPVGRSRGEVSLDQDRKGVPGSPDLVATIMRKIVESDVFVADVTSVGSVAASTPEKPPKKLVNSNVAIELGYATAQLSDERILMVMNGARGAREDLPFDLKHKAGPIIFNLEDDASKDQIKVEKKKLVSEFKQALGLILESISADFSDGHIEIPSTYLNATYFKEKEIVAEVEVGNEFSQYKFRDGPKLYLRLKPSRGMPLLRRVGVNELVQNQLLRPFEEDIVTSRRVGRNLYGSISFVSSEEDKTIINSSQVFLNREIWGVNGSIIRRRSSIRDRRSDKVSETYIYIKSVVQALNHSLRHYIRFISEDLEVEPPLDVELGASLVSGYELTETDCGPFRGTCFANEIVSKATLKDFEDSTIEGVAYQMLKDFFDGFGYSY